MTTPATPLLDTAAVIDGAIQAVELKNVLDYIKSKVNDLGQDLASILTSPDFATASEVEQDLIQDLIHSNADDLWDQYGLHIGSHNKLYDSVLVAAHGISDVDSIDTVDYHERLFLHSLHKCSALKDIFEKFTDAYGFEELYPIARNDRHEAWTKILDTGKIRDLDALRSLPTAIGVDKPGWYLIVLRDENDPSWYRLYVGQGSNIDDRIKEHKRNLRKGVGRLLYDHWRKPGRYPEFYLLGTANPVEFPVMGDLAPYLNIMEQFWSLGVQTLQALDLDKWLLPSSVRSTQCGLNMRLPIYQGYQDAPRGMASILASDDPEISEYAMGIVGKVHGKMRANDYKATSITARANSHKKHLWRRADPALGDPEEVLTICTSCQKTKHLDTQPTFEVRSGKYIIRQRCRCRICKDPKSGIGGKGTRLRQTR